MFTQDFTSSEQARLARAVTYKEASAVVLLQMQRLVEIHGRLDMVCGPISSGGLGSIEKNLEKFKEAIATLRGEGYPVFSQMPYEAKLHQIRDAAVGKHTYDMNLLEDFYRPVFSSGLVKKKHFMPQWHTSHGTNWEHALAKELGIEISYLGYNLLPLR